jgi:anti-sigma regulatory factor (Ser/Thr protein kinase)
MSISFERALALRNDLSELSRVNELFTQLAKEQHLSKEQLFAAKLCAHEAITNIISYAFDDACEHRIDVSVKVTMQEIRLEILDDGRPFDPLNMPYSVDGEAAGPSIGGQGIHLIRTFSKELHYKRIDSRNRLTISVMREDRPDGKSPSG